MGTLRKMGAFLGLVPDQANHYDGADGYPAEYDAHGYDAEYATDGAGYDGAGYGGAGEYGAGESSADGHGPGDYRDPSRPRSEDYAQAYGAYPYAETAEAAEHSAHNEYAAYAEYAAGAAADGRAADRQTAPEPAMQPAGIGGRRGGRSGGHGRQAEAPDYQTHGALAVQPQRDIDYAGAAMDVAGGGKPATVKLAGFADARQVGETYRDGQAVILDMTDLTDAEARRMVDFAAGLAFAVRGSIDKVTTKVFMLHPPTTDV